MMQISKYLSTVWARRLFWFGLGLLILPGIAAIALVMLVKGSDCALDTTSSAYCLSLGHALHQTFQHNLAVLTVLIYSLGLPLWLLLFSLHHSYKRWSRVLLAIACIWIVPHSYSILGAIAASILANGVCHLPGECFILGIEMGTTLFSQGTSLWFLFITLPMCSIATIIYPGLLVISMNAKGFNS